MLQAADNMVERFEGTWHLQADKGHGECGRSSTARNRARRSWAVLLCHSSGDGVVEGERPLCDPVSGSMKNDLVIVDARSRLRR